MASQIQSCKICILGKSKIGKTKIINKVSNDITGQIFNDSSYTYTKTMGANIYHLAGSSKNIDIWDIAGDVDFLGLGDVYLIDTQECWIITDSTNDINEWLRMCIRMNVQLRIIKIEDFENCLLTELGNKAGN